MACKVGCSRTRLPLPSPIHCCGCHASVAVACADEPCPQPLWPYVRLGSAGRMRTSAAYTELRTVLQRLYAHISVRMAHSGKHCAAEAIRSQSVRTDHNGKHCAAEAAVGYVSKIATTAGMPASQVVPSLQAVVFIQGCRQGSACHVSHQRATTVFNFIPYFGITVSSMRSS